MSASTSGGLGQRFAELFPFDWETIRHAGAEPVPFHLKKWWFCLGGTPMYLFIVQVATGIMLTFYYVPRPTTRMRASTPSPPRYGLGGSSVRSTCGPRTS